MLFSWYLLLAWMAICRPLNGADVTCPAECTCQEEMDNTHFTTCVVKDAAPVVRSVPASTSRLVILLAKDVYFEQRVNIDHLHELRQLTIDTESRWTMSHRVFIEGNLNNTKLEIFRSRARLSLDKADLFKPLSNLREITLSFTKLRWQDLMDMMKNSLSNMTSLETLGLRSFTKEFSLEIVGHFQPDVIFAALSEVPIRKLDLANNRLHYITANWQPVMKHLEYLDLSFNMFTYHSSDDPKFGLVFVLAVVLLRNIKFVEVSYQGQTESYKPNIWGERTHVVQKAISQNPLIARSNDDDYADPCECDSPPLPVGNLEYVGFADVQPVSMHPSLLGYTCVCFTEPNRLQYIDLHNTPAFSLVHQWTTNFMNLTNVRWINVQNCAVARIRKTFFGNLPSLEAILLGGNLFGLSMDHFYFSNNTLLRILDLANNGITQFYAGDVLSYVPNLTHLNLSGNSISSWNTNITMLTKLQVLNLSMNNFTVLPELLREQLDMLTSFHLSEPAPQSRIQVDIQGNPLSCLCKDIHFVTWLLTTKVQFYQRDRYICSHPVLGQTLLHSVNLDDLRNHCFPDIGKTIAISVIVSSLVTLLLVALIGAYCKRWHLRYWWYLLHSGWRRHQNVNDGTEYDYDVFVAHSNEDEEWVTGPLFNELETKRGLRLCFYRRDILPNEVLVQAIVERIERSRYTLLLLSPQFVNSNWCHFEMHIAQTRMCEEGIDAIVCVLLAPLPALSINKTLHNLLKKKVYLEWTTNEEGESLFWRKLAQAVGHHDIPQQASCQMEIDRTRPQSSSLD